MQTYIYTLSDPRDLKIRYVGKANDPIERYKNHMNVGRDGDTHKNNWIKSLKKIGLKPIIEVIDKISIDEWSFWETFWISIIKSWGFNLVNCTDGGDGTNFGNNGSFKKGSIPVNKGKKHTEEARAKISDALRGRKLSDETKKKISLILKGKPKKKTSNETREKLRKANLGKQSKCKKIVAKLDKITNEIIEIFPSAIEAVRLTKILGIQRACTGRAKTAGGFKWKYII